MVVVVVMTVGVTIGPLFSARDLRGVIRKVPFDVPRKEEEEQEQKE